MENFQYECAPIVRTGTRISNAVTVLDESHEVDFLSSLDRNCDLFSTVEQALAERNGRPVVLFTRRADQARTFLHECERAAVETPIIMVTREAALGIIDVIGGTGAPYRLTQVTLDDALFGFHLERTDNARVDPTQTRLFADAFSLGATIDPGPQATCLDCVQTREKLGSLLSAIDLLPKAPPRIKDDAELERRLILLQHHNESLQKQYNSLANSKLGRLTLAIWRRRSARLK